MGMNFLHRSCHTNSRPEASAPNPDPSRWRLFSKIQFQNAYVLRVKYLDCSNFEGMKILVYKGRYEHRDELDPHFSDDDNSPVARFKPTLEGLEMALHLASTL